MNLILLLVALLLGYTPAPNSPQDPPPVHATGCEVQQGTGTGC